MTALAKKEADPSDTDSLPPTVPPAAPDEGAAHTGRYAAGAIIAGKYQLVSVLGEGGMGSVWVAKNRTLDVEIALKLMRAELAENVEGIAERMLQEARAAASIGHPAIIQVFDFGFSEAGDPFIAMELLRGESLAELLRRRGRLTPVRAAQTLLPIADALAAAHAAGIIHRDMKPENCFLSRLGDNKRLQPKVLDFGIAKLEQRAQDRLTKDGSLIGSPAYMAPEQLRGDPDVDARVDVWALCVVLYQMVSGRRPFEGDSYHASMWNVANAEPRPLAEHEVDEPELWAIIHRGLAKDREQRFSSMRELGAELARWLIARDVQEDICAASLKAWIESSAVPGYSLFPAEEPAQRGPEAVSEPSLLTQPEQVETRGTRRIGGALLPRGSSAPTVPTAMQQRPSAPAVSGRGWVWITATAAVSAFVGAAVFASWSSEPESEPEQPVTSAAPRAAPAAAPRPRAPAAAPSSARPASPPLGASASAPDEDAASSARDEATPERTRAATPPRRTAPARAPSRRAGHSELKNPFR